MRSIGGELEHEKEAESVFFTDSGRSSLRLFVRSGYGDKKFIIPDYLCGVIEDVLIEEKVSYSFYHINDDLTVNLDSIEKKEYDVLYMINYFGIYHNLQSFSCNNKIIIEDNVFFNNFNNINSYSNWFSFNSFRKISDLPDGSMIKTNLPINESLIGCDEADFVSIKKNAKDKKYKYVNDGNGTEGDYLDLFYSAEEKINGQNNIHKMSNTSLSYLVSRSYHAEQKILASRYEYMKKMFPHTSIGASPSCYSFFPMVIKNRNKIRENLKKHGVYLPVHWPYSTVRNYLYDNVISIPLFSNYTDSEFMFLIEKLKEEIQW